MSTTFFICHENEVQGTDEVTVNAFKIEPYLDILGYELPDKDSPEYEGTCGDIPFDGRHLALRYIGICTVVLNQSAVTGQLTGKRYTPDNADRIKFKELQSLFMKAYQSGFGVRFA